MLFDASDNHTAKHEEQKRQQSQQQKKMSSVEVRDDQGKVLGRVRAGDTKLQALERLGRAGGAGGLYDRKDVGLLDTEKIMLEGGPYVFKPSSNQPENNNKRRLDYLLFYLMAVLETVSSKSGKL